MIPIGIWQKPSGAGYLLKFTAPVEGYPGDDEIADAAVMNERIEALVRERPDQYFWLHKRFKSRPDGAPRFYPQGL